MRLALVLGVLSVAAVLPGVASAHVGRTLPVATNFTARITGSVRGLAAKVVDGDQTLWLRVPAAATVATSGSLAGRVWAGSVVLALASSAAATRSIAAITALGLTAVAATWTVRLGRELYGRPDVPVMGWIGVALTCLIGSALPLLTHEIALRVLPSMLARLLEVIVLGAGIGTLLGSVFGSMERAQ